MEVYRGEPILSRIVYGPIQVYRRTEAPVKMHSRRGAEEEWTRFCEARDQIMERLGQLYALVLRDAGEAVASIFSAHASLLGDDELEQRIRGILCGQQVTAEYAVRAAANDLSLEFSTVDSPYIRARSADIRDVSNQVLHRLICWTPPAILTAGPAILATDDLLPSELMSIPAEKLLGVVCRDGSIYSHTAALMRHLGIPGLALVDVEGAWREGMALLDGEEGRLYWNPDSAVLERYRLAPEPGRNRGDLLPNR